MSLPILHADDGELVRYFCRALVDWTRQVAEEAELGFGTAFASRELKGVGDANCILEVALPEGMESEQAWSEAAAHYQRQGTACRQWVMHPGAGAERTGPMGKYLEERGFVGRTAEIMYLRQMTAREVAWPAGLHVIPARASFRHARLLAEEAAEAKGESQLAEAAMRRLDDPHWDALVGLRDGVGVAGAGVLTVGDAGLIKDVFVSREFRRQGMGRLMISRVLEVCGRARFKHVFVEVEQENTAGVELYREFGFERVGEITRYGAGESEQ